MPKITSSAELRNGYNEISTFCHQYGEPVFITKNGKGDLAVMSIEAYEELCGRFELYGLIKEGARAKDYELALLWLSDCGLVHKVNRVTVPNLPLKAYEDLRAFKLFFVDIGLLSCLAGLRQNVLLDGNELFKEFKGALTEQYVLQELKTRKGIQCYYWTAERGTAEVDFVVDDGADVFPIEVKAEINLQAKSLKVFHEKYRPAKSIRTSMADYKDEGWLINLPLWAVENI